MGVLGVFGSRTSWASGVDGRSVPLLLLSVAVFSEFVGRPGVESFFLSVETVLLAPSKALAVVLLLAGARFFFGEVLSSPVFVAPRFLGEDLLPLLG